MSTRLTFASLPVDFAPLGEGLSQKAHMPCRLRNTFLEYHPSLSTSTRFIQWEDFTPIGGLTTMSHCSESSSSNSPS